MVPALTIVVDEHTAGHDMTCNPFLCRRASMSRKLSSGSSISPSRYFKTCCMLGLEVADGCVHNNPI
jgi:hypothetical protein